MNRKLTGILAGLAAFACVLGGVFALPDAVDASAATGTFGSSLPSDWSLYSLSDTSHTTTSFSDGCMVVQHANGGINNKLYYGGVYEIDTDTTYTDFTFEITAKMTNPADDYRWFGVAYHTQKVGSNLIGYMMNYRYNGETASTAFDANKGFHDDAKDASVPLRDGQFHTMKITMKGTLVRHYIDNNLVKTWDVNTKNSHFGGSPLTSGGFALFVNRSVVTIRDYKISNTAENITLPDTTIADTYRTSSVPLINQGTVVYDVQDEAALNGLSSTGERPSNAILRFDKDCNIVGKDGEVLDSFADIYNGVLKGKIIPVLYLADEEAADAAITYLNEVQDILDLAVMADSPELVRKVKTANSKIRAILRYGEEANLYDIVRTTNMNFANVAVLPQSLATAQNVRYIHARFKTVWVTADSNSDSDLYTCIHSGAYGIITTDYAKLYDLYEGYSASGLVRTPFNVAHRGLPNSYNENSYSGTQAAIENGATHVELDAYLTTDKEIVLMHDGTIDRTSNGTGSVEAYSLSGLRNYQLDLHGRENIPTLDDVIPLFEGTDAVVVFEIKTNKTEIVSVLREKLEEYHFWEHLVVISFNIPILAEMKAVLPEVPTANLNTANASSMASVLTWMGAYNTGVDTNASGEDFNEYSLRDRGIVGWYWTMANSSALQAAAGLGYTGITNNAADSYARVPAMTEGVPGQEYVTLQVGDTVKLQYVTYDGNTVSVDGKAEAIVDMGEYWNVVGSFTSGLRYYSNVFRVEKGTEDEVAAKAVILSIQLLPEADAFTLQDEDALEAANEAYGALTEVQKALVTNVEKLNGLLARLAQLNQAKAQADAFIALIEAFPETITLEEKDEVAAARTVYDALSQDARSFVTEEQLKVLTRAEGKISLLDRGNTKDEPEEPVQTGGCGSVMFGGSAAVMLALGACATVLSRRRK